MNILLDCTIILRDQCKGYPTVETTDLVVGCNIWTHYCEFKVNLDILCETNW